MFNRLAFHLRDEQFLLGIVIATPAWRLSVVLLLGLSKAQIIEPCMVSFVNLKMASDLIGHANVDLGVYRGEDSKEWILLIR